MFTADGKTSMKHEYVLAIPEPRYSTYPAQVVITTSSVDPVNITLFHIGLNIQIQKTINRYEHADIELVKEARLKQETGNSNNTIIINASDAISVLCCEDKLSHPGCFPVLPTSYLGTEYYVATYRYSATNYLESFSFSALEQETIVNITIRGQLHEVSLQPFESYVYVCEHICYSPGLTGAFIQANNPISVLSSVHTHVPTNAGRGTLILNHPDVEKWGNEFVLAPFQNRSCGDVYRVVAAKPTTLVISNVGNVTLNTGEFYEGEVPLNTLVTITSNENILVVQFMKGYNACDGYGAPSMMVVLPTHSYYNNVIFPVLNHGGSDQAGLYINVLTHCNTVNGLLLDEAISISDWEFLRSDDLTMCCVHGKVSEGVHSVSHAVSSATFSVSVYRAFEYNSYAFEAGISSTGKSNKNKNKTKQKSQVEDCRKER